MKLDHNDNGIYKFLGVKEKWLYIHSYNEPQLHLTHVWSLHISL
jgi:hypothetical protein